MASDHEYGSEFVNHMETTQQAYEERRLDDYIAGFSDDYFSVQLNTDWSEDKAQLAAKIRADFERFEMLSMEFTVLRTWYTGDTGFAQLRYHTRLKYRDSGKILVDDRENLIVGRHYGNGRWLVCSKIVLTANNYFESEAGPDI